jgi:hypothetical protein
MKDKRHLRASMKVKIAYHEGTTVPPQQQDDARVKQKMMK